MLIPGKKYSFVRLSITLAEAIVPSCFFKALESDSNENIFEHPKHQYTRSLLDAMPKFKGLAPT